MFLLDLKMVLEKEFLITCQHDEDAEESNTFGPLPLDFFHN